MQQRVQFVICGAQKAGTTALADYLRQHPGIYIPEAKELHFFDDESQDWLRPDLQTYHHHFRLAKSGQIWGEATPIYMYWEDCAKRIWQYNPEVKIVLVLRNPITRAYSHWAMESERGAETLGFEDALQQEELRKREALPLQDRVHSYLDRGYYSHQIRRLWRFFGQGSVLILRQEELKEDPLACVNKVLSHIGTSTLPAIKQQESNLGTYKQRMSERTALKLRKLYWHEICQIEGLLGWDCHQWLEQP